MYTEVFQKSRAAGQIYGLWSECAGENDFPYKSLNSGELERLLLAAEPGIGKMTLLHESGRAFASGSYTEDEGRGFITMVLTAADARRSGLGSEMLYALEAEMKKRFHLKEIHISYFDPVNLVWEIPGHPGCEHPNSPGVDISSPAYEFFHAAGYQDYSRQNSYFRQIRDYEIPASIREIEARLNADGYFIRVYDPDTMEGMADLIDYLGNSMWRRSILGEPIPADGGRPILVPVKNGRVLGFAGPLDVEVSGRGFFSGIAVDPSARGRGVAKVLFSALCANLRAIGAGYMTLFTGEDNPARRIYEAAGFTIVKSWADMKKEV